MEETFSASMALVTYGGKLLLVLRDDIPTITNPNHWHLIGGKAENDETPEQTVKREIFEEIGIKPTNIKFLFKRDDKPVSLFQVELTDEEAKDVVLGDEGQELRYFSKEELTPDLKVTGTLGILINQKREILDQYLD